MSNYSIQNESCRVEKNLQYLISQIGIVHNSKHSCTVDEFCQLSMFWDGFPLLPLELSSSTVAMLPLLLLKLEGKNIDDQKKPKSIYKSGLGDTLAQLPKSAGLRRQKKQKELISISFNGVGKAYSIWVQNSPHNSCWVSI